MSSLVVMGRRLALLALAALWAPAPALAQIPGETPPPIPQDPLAGDVPTFIGSPAAPDPAPGQDVPRHPFMAPNGLSNTHDDAYQTDTYDWAGPLGDHTAASSALFLRECGTVTFDSSGRLVTVCIGLDRPVLAMLDPVTLEPLAAMNLPPRPVSTS